MRGKDYCNCEHAQFLCDAINEAWVELALPTTYKERLADAILRKAIDADHDALKEYCDIIDKE